MKPRGRYGSMSCPLTPNESGFPRPAAAGQPAVHANRPPRTLWVAGALSCSRMSPRMNRLSLYAEAGEEFAEACPSFGQPRRFHVMLITGDASHVRTNRPHPAPVGAGLARGVFYPVASPRPRGLSAPCGTPEQGATLHPPKEPSALPWNPSTKARSPLEPDGGLSHPPTTRRSFRGPGTHEQAAFLPLHPDEGNPSPLDPTTGLGRREGGAH